MFGRIVYSDAKRVVLRREELSGAVFETACIPARRTAPRHVRKAARLFRRCGVHRVLVPAGFSYWKVLSDCGMGSVDVVPFLQAMAPSLALAALKRGDVLPEQATVVLAGARVSRPLRDTALSLCPVLRRLLIRAPSGGRELAEFLRREYGLPYLEHCPDPQLVLAFSETWVDPGAPVLRLYDPADLLGLCIRPRTVAVPEGSEPLSFLAALWELGRIAPGDVEAFPPEST